MSKPRQFTPDDLKRGESIYFVSFNNPIPVPIEDNNSKEWGYYFPNKIEAEKWVEENKQTEKDKGWFQKFLDRLF